MSNRSKRGTLSTLKSHKPASKLHNFMHIYIHTHNHILTTSSLFCLLWYLYGQEHELVSVIIFENALRSQYPT